MAPEKLDRELPEVSGWLAALRADLIGPPTTSALAWAHGAEPASRELSVAEMALSHDAAVVWALLQYVNRALFSLQDMRDPDGRLHALSQDRDRLSGRLESLLGRLYGLDGGALRRPTRPVKSVAAILAELAQKPAQPAQNGAQEPPDGPGAGEGDPPGGLSDASGRRPSSRLPRSRAGGPLGGHRLGSRT